MTLGHMGEVPEFLHRCGDMRDATAIKRDGVHIYTALRKFRTQHAPKGPVNVSRDHFSQKTQATIRRQGITKISGAVVEDRRSEKRQQPVRCRVPGNTDPSLPMSSACLCSGSAMHSRSCFSVHSHAQLSYHT